MAVPWLLRPYKWQTHFIPFLPPSFADFLSAPVPFIAGVLSAPLAGYDDDVVVLRVAEDRVDGVDALPRLPALDELVAKLGPPHEHLSQCVAGVREGRPSATAHSAHRRCAATAQGCGGRNEFKRRCQAAEPATTQEVMDGILLIISSAIRSIVSLREIRGHCVGGRDLVSDEVLTKETKINFLKTVGQQERPFMAELLDTQLFAAYLMNEVSTWFSHKNPGGAETTCAERALIQQQGLIDQLSLKLAQSNEVVARLSRGEHEMLALLEQKDAEIAKLQKQVAAFMELGLDRPHTD